MNDAVRSPVRGAARWSVAAGAVIVTVWLGAVAWLAVPRYEVCIAIFPAPAGCTTANRAPTAAVATVVMLAAFVVLLWLARRQGDRRWATWSVTALIACLALASYRVVLFA